MTKERKLAVIIAVILILAGLVSFFALSKTFSDPENFESTIQMLDEKKTTVAKLSAISIAAASAIDLIPGDAGKSISEALVNLGGFFVILFAAIYLEKLLISIGGLVAFKYLIPIGLFLMAAFVLVRKEALKSLGLKLIAMGLVLFLLVPASMQVSTMVDKTHDMSKQQAIQEIGEETDILEESSAETSAEDAEAVAEAEEEETGFFGKIKAGGSALLGKVKDGSSSVLTSAKEVPKKMNTLLDNLIEEIAYFFVSVCLIPVAVLLLLVVLVKQVLGVTGPSAAGYASLLKELKKKNAE